MSLAVVMIAAACNGRETVERTTFSDSAGVSMVANRLAGQALPVWGVSAAPLADIGADESQDTQLLFDVAGANRLSDGRIVIAEGGGSRLRVYTAAGVWLSDWGREGAGPGEFRNPGRAYVVPGDSVIVWDSRLRRFSLFAPSGAFIRTWSFAAPGELVLNGVPVADGGTAVSPVALMAGTEWLARPGFSFSSDMPTGIYRDTIPYLRFDIDGAFIDGIGRFPAHQNFLFNDAGSAMAGSLPFHLETHIAATGDGFWICTGDRFEIDHYSVDGRLLLRASVTDASLDLTPSRFEAWQDEALSDVTPDQRQFFERFVRAVPKPAHLPACKALIVDAADQVWVRGHAWPGDGDVAWHVFGPGGALLATALLPERLTVHAIGLDWLLGTWLDQDDVEHVRLLRLERPAN